MVDVNLGPYLQEQLKDADKLQKQIESLMAQQYQYEVKLREDKKTLEYLNKNTEGEEIYREIGSILVRVKDVESFKKEIEEDVEIAEMKLKSLKDQISQSNEKLKGMSEEINKLYQKSGKQN
ncbi:MAG: prefoldin subunit beta [Candidatus Thermoplasmatota archaeon]|jgi:prefoldin beta subunit|nr:prefoldin subunit beta [Candidatus Thermoplasmatota archaeon]